MSTGAIRTAVEAECILLNSLAHLALTGEVVISEHGDAVAVRDTEFLLILEILKEKRSRNWVMKLSEIVSRETCFTTKRAGLLAHKILKTGEERGCEK